MTKIYCGHIATLKWIDEYLSPENEEKRKADRAEFAKLGIKSVPISEFINNLKTNKTMSEYKELPKKARMCVDSFYYNLYRSKIELAYERLKLLEGKEEEIEAIQKDFPFIRVGYILPRTDISFAKMLCYKEEGSEYNVSIMMSELGEFYYNKNK